MQALIDTYKNTGGLHHAYVIEGDRDTVFTALQTFLDTDMKWNTHANPDFWHATYDSFGVEDARDLKEMQQHKAFGEHGKKIFIVSFNFITLEAQNSLLKVFEEPTSGTHFFIITPSADIFLPTIRSRVIVVSHDTDGSGKTSNKGDVSKFLKSTHAERLEIVTDIVEDKEKIKAIEFLNQLERELSEKWGTDLDQEKINTFKEIIKCRRYLGDRAPSVKLILEHVALSTPIC